MLSTKNIYLKDIIIWLLFPFVLGLLTLSYIPGWSNIMIAWGIVYVLIYFVYSIYMEFKLQPEVIIYLIWIVWSLSGVFFAIDMDVYIEMLTRLIQMGLLIFVVAGIISIQKNLSIILAAFAISGIILAVISYLSGEFQIASDLDSELQANSILENANEFAYQLLFVIISLFYFLERVSAKVLRIAFIIIIILIFLAIVLSGSRQGFIAAILFMLIWFATCKRKTILQNPKVALSLLLLFFIFIFILIQYVLPQTHLGQRFADPSKQSDTQRIDLYLDGFEMIQNNLIFGVGLNQYRVHSVSNDYSHSYYMEVLTNTGIIGFTLYFSIYVLLWRRLSRLKRVLKDSKDIYIVGFFKSVIITILIIGITRPLIVSKLTCLFLAAAIGYSWAMERTLGEKST